MKSHKQGQSICKSRMNYIKNVRVKAPVEVGDIIVSDLADTGVPLIATKRVSE